MRCLFYIFLYKYSSLVLDAQLSSLYTKYRLILSPVCPWLWNSAPAILKGRFWVPLHCGLKNLLWYRQSCVSVPLSVISMGEHSCPPCCGYCLATWENNIFLFIICRKFFPSTRGMIKFFWRHDILTYVNPFQTRGTHVSPFPDVFCFSVITGPSKIPVSVAPMSR